jgi:four helix bundle protein
MNRSDFQKRTKQFALDVINCAESLSCQSTRSLLVQQLLRAATSVAANYRAACRARSTPDFLSKLGIVEEEADESRFWLELLQESGLVKDARAARLMQEADEITAMTVASIKRVRQTPHPAQSNRRSPRVTSEITNPKSEIT